MLWGCPHLLLEHALLVHRVPAPTRVGSACCYWNGYGTQRSHPAQTDAPLFAALLVLVVPQFVLQLPGGAARVLAYSRSRDFPQGVLQLQGTSLAAVGTLHRECGSCKARGRLTLIFFCCSKTFSLRLISTSRSYWRGPGRVLELAAAAGITHRHCSCRAMTCCPI